MDRAADLHDLALIAASLGATVEFLRQAGEDELLATRGWRRPDAARSDGEAEPSALPVPGSPASAADGLEALRSEIGDCTRCPLHRGRRSIVFGEGCPTARLVFVGEGPGREEDLRGVPFVGAAGQLLTRIVEAIHLTRDEVYICNVVKCRPPDNRVPEPLEQRTCGAFLERQLALIRPEVVVCLGATAAGYLLGTDDPVGRLRGRFHQRGDAVLLATYHPAYLLRTPAAKRPVWEDMKMVRDRLGLAR